MTVTVQLTHEGREREFECVVSISPGEPACLTGSPDYWHPGADPTMDDLDATDTETGEVIEDETLLDLIEEAIWEAIENEY